jgi:hypothetical protein
MEKKSEKALAQNEMERDRRALETLTKTPRPKDVEEAKALVPKEGKLEDATVPQVKAEAKKAEAPSPKTEVMEYRTFAKEAGRAKAPSPESEKVEKGWHAKEKSMVSSKPPQEIILRISDRGKVISKLHELVKQFGGEMVTTEKNMVVASLPTGSFSEFEKELAGLSSSGKTDVFMAKKHATGSLRVEEGMKREEVDQQTNEPAKFAADTERRTIVRIFLVQE